MDFPRFKLIYSTTKEEIGVEYLTISGWKNMVFDYPERDGTFDERELGDGYLGIVQRKLFTGKLDKFKNDIYEGDEISPGNFVEFSLENGFSVNGDRPLAAFYYLFS